MSSTPNTALVMQLTNLNSVLIKRLDGALVSYGISYTEFTVMFHLNQAPNGSLRRIDLAEKVGLSASGVTRLLNPMQKIGLVEKEESARDARVSLVKLTNAGEKIYRESEKILGRSADAFLKPLDSQQLAALADTASRLIGN